MARLMAPITAAPMPLMHPMSFMYQAIGITGIGFPVSILNMQVPHREAAMSGTKAALKMAIGTAAIGGTAVIIIDPKSKGYLQFSRHPLSNEDL